MVRKVLCPTDFSEGAEAGWNVALALAMQFEAEVILLHVVPEPPRLTEAYQRGYTPERFIEATAVEARRLLEHLAAKAADCDLKTSWKVRRGVEFREISAAAAEEGADLIVLGTHGRSALPGLLLGSVAERVAGAAPCPVLLVRSPAFHSPLLGTEHQRAAEGRERAAT